MSLGNFVTWAAKKRKRGRTLSFLICKCSLILQFSDRVRVCVCAPSYAYSTWISICTIRVGVVIVEVFTLFVTPCLFTHWKLETHKKLYIWCNQQQLHAASEWWRERKSESTPWFCYSCIIFKSIAFRSYDAMILWIMLS